MVSRNLPITLHMFLRQWNLLPLLDSSVYVTISPKRKRYVDFLT